MELDAEPCSNDADPGRLTQSRARINPRWSGAAPNKRSYGDVTASATRRIERGLNEFTNQPMMNRQQLDAIIQEALQLQSLPLRTSTKHVGRHNEQPTD